jgi:hypothetical protein
MRSVGLRLIRFDDDIVEIEALELPIERLGPQHMLQRVVGTPPAVPSANTNSWIRAMNTLRMGLPP